MWHHGQLYKHIDNTDVAFEVLKSSYIREKDEWSLKVTWWNIVHAPRPMNVTQRIRVPESRRKLFLSIWP